MGIAEAIGAIVTLGLAFLGLRVMSGEISLGFGGKADAHEVLGAKLGDLDVAVVVFGVEERARDFVWRALDAIEKDAEPNPISRRKTLAAYVKLLSSVRAAWLCGAARDTVPMPAELARDAFERVVEDYRARARGIVPTDAVAAPKGYRDAAPRAQELCTLALVVVTSAPIRDVDAPSSRDELEHALLRLIDGSTLHRLALVRGPEGSRRLRVAELESLHPELVPLEDAEGCVICHACGGPNVDGGARCRHCGVGV
ncbi:MAG: hypothetical protein KF901_15250 [Myxococcales bacterium]|nr:hypothetical protein [Myxococcales bacterium]